MDAAVDWLGNRTGSDHQFTELDFDDRDWKLAEAADDFAAKEIEPAIDAIEGGDQAGLVRLLEQAGEIGLLATDVPVEHGGLGLRNAASLLIAERLAVYPSFSVSLGVHTGIGSLPLVYYGTNEQRRLYLRRLASGKAIAAYALTEPMAGSDALSLRSRAVFDPNAASYRLSGTKQFVTNAGFADVFILFARVPEAGVTAFLVDRDSPGLSFGPEERKLGLRGTSTRTIYLEEVEIQSESMLGVLGEGHKIAFNMLNIGRLKLGAGSAGVAKRCLRLALDHAKERRQFGRLLADFGMIRSKLSEMAALIYVTDSMGYRTAGMLDRARQAAAINAPRVEERAISESVGRCALECSILKVFGSEAFQFAADEALQILGGYGFMETNRIERYYRDARAYRIFEGTNEVNRLFLFKAFSWRLAQGRPQAIEGTPKEGHSVSVDRWLQEALDLVDCVKALASSTLVSLGREALDPMGAEDQMLVQLAADVLIDLYAIDSTLARTRLLRDTGPRGADELRGAMTTVFLGTALPRMLSRVGALGRRLAGAGGLDPHLRETSQDLEYAQLRARERVAELLLGGCLSPIEFGPEHPG